ncbi:MAG: hypothetical protein ACREOF_04440 [Gemmatimonadales bacterium]
MPQRLLAGVTAARFLAGIHAPFFHQVVLAEFMAGGHLLRHIRRMRGPTPSGRPRSGPRPPGTWPGWWRWGARRRG